jgi:cell fate (sporulation/competence/biofilm development) regulator YlbF (YheA/YmcA/DUF963 family)
MSGNPYDNAHELSRSIIKSEVFQNYLQAKNNLDQKPESRDKVLEFRNRQMAVNRAQMTGEKIDGEQIRELSTDYAKINQDQDIAAFFNAEAEFIKMFNDIQEIIRQSIDRVLAE